MPEPSINDLNIGARVRLLRQSKRETQEDVANKLGVSLSYYSKLELGQRNFSTELLDKIAHLYNTNTAWLYGNDESKKNLTAKEGRAKYGTQTGALKDYWLQIFFECIGDKKNAIEIAVKEYRIPFEKAIEPAIREFEKRMELKNE